MYQVSDKTPSSLVSEIFRKEKIEIKHIETK